MPTALDWLALLRDPDILRAVQALPTMRRLGTTLARAMQGDPNARAYLRGEGIYEAVEMVRPGAGMAAKAAYEAVKGFRTGDIVDAEFRELDGEEPEHQPWDRYVSWLLARRHGAFIVLGPRGSGKTFLSMRLAEHWHGHRKWPAEAVNVYQDDAPDWMIRISAKRFHGRLKALGEYLDVDDYDIATAAAKQKQADVTEESDEGTEDIPAIDIPSIDSIKQRIVVIDEASLIGTSLGRQKGRQLLEAMMAQTRHMEWLCVYIAQTTRMLPLSMLGTADSILIKRPVGGESGTDRPDVPEIKALWDRATTAFSEWRRSEWYALVPDDRQWCYVECPDLYGRPWRGMMPIRPKEELKP